MEMLDAWIDDYLRVIVRTRPWTKRREEEALEELVEWARRSGEPPRSADDVVRCAQRFAAAHAGSPEGDRVGTAVRNFVAWATREGILSPVS